MKYSNIILGILIIMATTHCSQNEGSQGKAFTDKVDNNANTVKNDSELLTFFDNPRTPISHAIEALPTGSNFPKGWLYDMMKEDLNTGIVGALAELYPGIKADDLYHTARRGGMDDIPEMGDLVLTGEAWETSIMWWNAETIGNWWDGFVRHAFLTNNKDAIAQSRAIVENLLASQDGDGYIGIYKENLRYQHEGSNGELWAQTTAFRMLLAYYELTQQERVLEAVEKAMAVTMKRYNKDSRNPFDLKNAFGGVTHGLMMTDVCETLFRITGKEVYQDYATYLYRAYSTFDVNRAFNDIRYSFLMEKEEPFTAHGVHTYEHLRSLVNAYYHTGYDELETAYENAMYKLESCMLPSGAGHGMEWIAGLDADPSNTGAEYCTMLELRNFFGSASFKTGDLSYADRAEILTFNGMLGARNENGTAITYGKSDNCYKLDGKSLDGEEPEVRYKYSPTHSEPAVCCVPNYTRNYTYYLDQMWGKKDDGLVAILYGPSELKTSFRGKQINIEQVTDYPYSDIISFEITTSEPIKMALYFRKPSWSKNLVFGENNGATALENGFYQIQKTWETGDKITIHFENEVQAKTFRNGEMYHQRGPLVYALDIPWRRENIKQYELDGFYDYYAHAEIKDYEDLSIVKGNMNFEFTEGKELILKGQLMNSSTKQLMDVELVPMSKTVLRRVTFPVLE